jgi:hypothetical protein
MHAGPPFCSSWFKRGSQRHHLFGRYLNGEIFKIQIGHSELGTSSGYAVLLAAKTGHIFFNDGPCTRRLAH